MNDLTLHVQAAVQQEVERISAEELRFCQERIRDKVFKAVPAVTASIMQLLDVTYDNVELRVRLQHK